MVGSNLLGITSLLVIVSAVDLHAARLKDKLSVSTASVFAAEKATQFPAKTSTQDDKTVRIGFFLLPPNMYLDEKLTPSKGASLVYCEQILKKCGYQVEWVGPMTIPRITEMCQTGQLDGTLFFTKTLERAETFAYPEQPYVVNSAVLAVRRSNPIKEIRSLRDIKGWKIIYISGGDYPQFFGRGQEQITFHPIASTHFGEQSLKMLLSGRGDAVLALNQWTFPYEANRLQVADKVKILPIPEPPVPMYIAFSKTSPLMPKILENYNMIMLESPLKYSDILKNY